MLITMIIGGIVLVVVGVIAIRAILDDLGGIP